MSAPQPRNGLRAQGSGEKRYGVQEGALHLGPGRRGQLVQFLWVVRRECISKRRGESTIGHPQRRQAVPGPRPGRGLSGNVTAEIYIHTHIYINHPRGWGRRASEDLTGHPVARHARLRRPAVRAHL